LAIQNDNVLLKSKKEVAGRSKLPRRGRLEIYGEILKAIEEDVGKNGEARLTRVQGIVNISYRRFRGFIQEMIDKELVSIEKSQYYYEVKLQFRGFEYLRHFAAIREYSLDTFS
jgi:predicted transcriptional regulator